MWCTIDIVESVKPKFVIWENVKNLLSKKHIHNFNNYLEKMDKLGYNSYYQVLNAKDFSIPQNRERVYTISIKKDIDSGNFQFPNKQELNIRLKDILENNCNNVDTIDSFNKRTNTSEICPTITTRSEGFKTAILPIQNYRIRKLTPKECWRLMRFYR